jgi:hypothetical protein
MLNFIVWIAATLIVLYASYQIVKKTVAGAVKVFPIPYKLVPTYEIFYSLTILMLCCVSAYTVIRPGGMISHSLDALEDRITQVDWMAIARYPVDAISMQYTKIQQRLRNLEVGSQIGRLGSNIATWIGSAWSKTAKLTSDVLKTISDFFTRTLASFEETSTTPVTSRTNIKATVPAEFSCIASPGAPYVAVLLRNEPSWNSVEVSRVSIGQGAEIKFASKLENQEGIWFVIDSTTDIRRYVNAAICSTSSDLNMIPTASPEN